MTPSRANAGKTVDAMYTTDRLTAREIDGLNKFYEKSFKSGSAQIEIMEYLPKADFVPIDFRILNSENKKIFMDYAKTLPIYSRKKIIIVR